MGLFLIPEKNLNQSPVISGLPLRSRKLVLCWISLNRNSSYLFAWVLICFVIRGISVASLELLHSQLDNASRFFFFFAWNPPSSSGQDILKCLTQSHSSGYVPWCYQPHYTSDNYQWSQCWRNKGLSHFEEGPRKQGLGSGGRKLSWYVISPTHKWTISVSLTTMSEVGNSARKLLIHSPFF